MVFDILKAYETLDPYFQERIHRHEPLMQHSSFGAGGPADLWIFLETQQELINLVRLCAERQWPLLVVGAGSNILFADAGVRGIVASIKQHTYHIEEQSDGSANVIADAGVHWDQLLHDLVPLGWGGLEFGAGIPGTLGAGIISNAGTHDQNLGQILEWIEVLDARGCNVEESTEYTPAVTVIRRYEQNELDLGYRHSRFRELRLTHIDEHGQLILAPRSLIEPPEMVITVGLRLHQQDPKVLYALIDKQKQNRKQGDPELLHSGSIFKDPPGAIARTLIEQAGLGGKTQGNARISKRNANYIENLGQACASDIAALIVEAHQQVLQQSGIHLALNVELLGAW